MGIEPVVIHYGQDGHHNRLQITGQQFYMAAALGVSGARIDGILKLIDTYESVSYALSYEGYCINP
jgi:hypothetical protein